MNERVGGCELDPHNDLFNNVFSIGKGLNTSFEMNFVDNWLNWCKQDKWQLVGEICAHKQLQVEEKNYSYGIYNLGKPQRLGGLSVVIWNNHFGALNSEA
jgi:hypothetical protein